jgi:hypothetical protein
MAVFDGPAAAFSRKMGCQQIWHGDIVDVSRKQPA